MFISEHLIENPEQLRHVPQVHRHRGRLVEALAELAQEIDAEDGRAEVEALTGVQAMRGRRVEGGELGVDIIGLVAAAQERHPG